ncbi:MAG: glycosyltransferase family 4 protein [Acidimicrobiales bacterium]|nr:glycosyltransferase family 4 protein [Acidimicrobiales bacterium]MDG2218656.1 glycosyltransferase family 4 protein [Acidimicrobiales bacterium]
MRVLVICPHFDPDPAPTGVVMTEIVHRVAEQGHEVEIVTSLPWYTEHAVEPEWRGQLWRTERTAWGRITRVHPFPTDKRNIPARALGFVGFTGLAGLLLLLRRRRPDVVLAMSPPLTLGLPAWVTARVRRVPFVFNVQDIFPDVAMEVGAITDPTIIGIARWLERFIYRRADAVTVLSDDLAENVSAKIGEDSSTKVRVIANFVDTERIQPAERRNSYRDHFDLGDRTVVMYAGNLGFSQPLELLIDAARAMTDREDVVFVINGGGSERPRLQVLAADLDNVHFIDFQPPERLSETLAAGDIHVIALRKGLARSSVPSKLYSILAAGRPVLASIDPETEVERVLLTHECGVTCQPEDSAAFIETLRELLDNPDATAAMGDRGRRFVESWVSPTGVATAYIDLFDELRSSR